jgi:hypothetical protein
MKCHKIDPETRWRQSWRGSEVRAPLRISAANTRSARVCIIAGGTSSWQALPGGPPRHDPGDLAGLMDNAASSGRGGRCCLWRTGSGSTIGNGLDRRDRAISTAFTLKLCRLRSWNWKRCKWMGGESAARLLISQTSTEPTLGVSVSDPGARPGRGEAYRLAPPQGRRWQVPVDPLKKLLQCYLVMVRHPDMGHHLDNG